MLSTYQKRLKKAFDELPVKLKFKTMVTNYLNGYYDKQIIRDASPSERAQLIFLSEIYQELTLDYTLKRQLDLALEVLELKKELRLEADITVDLLKTCLYFLDIIDRFNQFEAENPHIQEFCDKWKGLLNKTKDSSEKLAKLKGNCIDIDNDNSLINSLESIRAKIEQKENQLGFAHLLGNC